MRVASVIIVGGETLDRAAVQAAASTVWPEVKIQESANFTAVLSSADAANGELLILIRPAAAEVAAALQARDARGLPAWPVVVFGSAFEQAGAIGVDESEWPGPAAAQALRLAPEVHALRREAVRLRGDLLTIGRRVAHDLRTPLNSAATAVQALAELGPEASAIHAQMSQTALTAIRDSAAVVERLSPILKATAGGAAFRPIKMKEVVWSALQRLEALRRQRGVNITEPDDWPSVYGVAPWLELVWQNLVANSLVHGSAKEVELAWTRSENEFVFTVRDNGAGVAREQAFRCFTPFDRMHELDAPRGLGLAIVHRLVELQGGRCGREFSTARGAVFYFTLPAGDRD